MTQATRGKIEEIRQSQSGKTLGIKLSGKWYSTKCWDLQEMVGETIEAGISSSEYNGKTIWWINDYQKAQFQTADEAMQTAMASQNITHSAPVSKPAVTQEPLVDRDASIVAQTLCKASCKPGDSLEETWGRYAFFYQKYVDWKMLKETSFSDSDDFPF